MSRESKGDARCHGDVQCSANTFLINLQCANFKAESGRFSATMGIERECDEGERGRGELIQ